MTHILVTDDNQVLQILRQMLKIGELFGKRPFILVAAVQPAYLPKWHNRPVDRIQRTEVRKS